MREGRARVVRRVDEDALDLARVLLLECLQGQQIVPEDELVVKQIILAHPMRRMARPLRVVQEDAA